MIQLNLLPKVKLDFVKAKRTQRLTLLAATLVSALSIGIFVILFITTLAQKKHSNNLSEKIKNETTQLKQIQDLNKIITIQNQLNGLPELHKSKPVATRLFNFIKKITPDKITIESFDIDFSQENAGTIKISGQADTVASINVFMDTLKFTTYKTSSNVTGDAFSDAVLTFGISEKKVTYDITLKFNPTIFSSEAQVELLVPSGKVTSRSETEKPDSVFKTNDSTQQGGQ